MILLPDPVPGPIELRSPRRFLLHLAARQWRSLLAAGLLGTAWSLSQAGVPLVVGRTLDAGVLRHNGAALLTGCLVITALGLSAAVTGTLRHRFAVSNWLQASSRTQQWLGHHLADQGLAVSARTTTGEAVQTISGDAPRLGNLYDIVARGSGALGAYLLVTVLLVRMDLMVGLWVAIGAPLLSATMAAVVRPLKAREEAHRGTEGELTALGADTVAGLRVLRGIGGEQQFLDRYHERSQQVRQAGVRVAGLQAGLNAAHVLLPGLFVVSLTWLGARAAITGRLTPGELLTIYGYAAFLRLPLETVTEALSKAVLARVGAERMIAILTETDAAPAGKAPAGRSGRPGPTLTGRGSAQAQPGSAQARLGSARARPMPPAGVPIHDPASGLTVTPGLFTAMVTARPEQAAVIADRLARLDRAGGATLAAGARPTADGTRLSGGAPFTAGAPLTADGPNLPTDGTSLAGAGTTTPPAPRLGGVPIDELDLTAVRARILLSEAEPRLFSGTLRAGIDPYDRHRDDEVLAAIAVADATDVLEALPDGLAARIEERGRDLSGGQRQRLVLARAVLADPEVLVLVEPTSSVDAHTEARVAHRLRAARAGRTTLVATASPLLLDLCDQVALLVDGLVTAVGSHQELLRDSAEYREVVGR